MVIRFEVGITKGVTKLYHLVSYSYATQLLSASPRRGICGLRIPRADEWDGDEGDEC